MTGARRAAMIMLAVAPLAGGPARASSSGDELIRQARAHEAAHEDDLAARRYMEALAIDSPNPAAWIGLAELRLRTREFSESERVYTAALARIPSLSQALEGRAQARWALGRHTEAESDLQTYAETAAVESAYRKLAEWFASDGRAPAQLATWRSLLALITARLTQDRSPSPGSRESEALETSVHEARRMVQALSIVVDGADPACSPIEPDATRLGLARIARLGR